MSDKSLAIGKSFVFNGDNTYALDAGIDSVDSKSKTHSGLGNEAVDAVIARLLNAVSTGDWSADNSMADVASAGIGPDTELGTSTSSMGTSKSPTEKSANTSTVNRSAPVNVITSMMAA